MRARITFSKAGALRYIGHLDLQTLWERSARRAGLPLAYSLGFHPQPKISFASALPLGFSSRAEVMDIRLEAEVELSDLRERFREALPPGIDILDVQQVDDGQPPLQTLVSSAEYEIALIEKLDASLLQQDIERVLAASGLPRERRGKPYDLRPLIEALSVHSEGEDREVKITMRLSSREGATGRPEEVLAELGIAARDARIERSRLIFQG